MPKIRDLGISFIPATMRPPEIGAGGGYFMGEDCENNTKPTNPCGDGSCTLTDGDEDDDCRGCTGTGNDQGGGGGGGGGCGANTNKPGHKLDLTGFGPQAVAQLKQQLRNEISKGLEY